MTSREQAIKVVAEQFAADFGDLRFPIDQVRITAVLDVAAANHQIHYADQCPGNKGQRQTVRDLRAAKRKADDNCVALVTERDALRDRVRVLEVIRQRVSDGWAPLRCEPPVTPRWSRCDMDPEPFEPGVSGVLWPDEETQ